MNLFIYTDLRENLRQQILDAFPNHAVHFHSEKDGQKLFASADIVLGNVPKSWFAKDHHLIKFWQLDSAGFDQYQDVAVTAVVANMGDFFAVKCAETMLAGIMAHYRQINELVKLQSQKKWVGKPLRYQLDLLTNKRVIILGAGTIGKSMAKLLTGFDCNLKFMARSNPEAEIHDVSSFIKILPEIDLVINTLPGKAGMIVNKEVLEAMSTNCLYASVGRGSTTDESTLIKLLQEGRIAGAILDVTMQEPLPADSPLWSMKNVILTQHTGGGHKLEDEGKVALFIDNATKFLQGLPVLHQVNLREGY